MFEENNLLTPVLLTQVKVDDKNDAFNLIVNFIHLAQKRGAFTLHESAKISSCLDLFVAFEPKN